MPHTTSPYSGFQAVILCGPGASLGTFTSNPKEFPKALIPVANRPMVWYPLDWCYRMGISDITLITPPESAAAIESALAQNPHLTALPAPKPTVLAPKGLTQTTGTGTIFKLPEVVKAVKTDFLVLPCDLVMELDGSSLIQTWMTLQGGLGETGMKESEHSLYKMERTGRRGGLGVYYPVKNLDGVTHKIEQTDFVATVKPQTSLPISSPDSMSHHVRKVVLSIPTATVKDTVEEQGALGIRHSLLKQNGRVAIKTGYRDAHIYFFPRWILEMINENEFESLGEDVIGWYAKAGWQVGLSNKLGISKILNHHSGSDNGDDPMMSSMTLEEEIDLQGMSSTSVRASPLPSSHDFMRSMPPSRSASIIRLAPPTPDTNNVSTSSTPRSSTIPPLLAYLQPSTSLPSPSSQPQIQPLIRRVDTAQLLLLVSLHLAKLPPSTHPLSHNSKIAHSEMIQPRSRVSESDSLIAENVNIASRVTIKESVVGVGCSIGEGCRLTRCLLMDGVVVEDGVSLTGCIIGRRARIERKKGKKNAKGDAQQDGEDGGNDGDTKLVDCEVQNGFVVEAGSMFSFSTFSHSLFFLYRGLVYGTLTDSYMYSRGERREIHGV